LAYHLRKKSTRAKVASLKESLGEDAMPVGKNALDRIGIGLKRYSLRNDVLKRELIDGQEASGAATLLKKATRAAVLPSPPPAPLPVVAGSPTIAVAVAKP
jgi:hypothetical protein